MPGTDPSTLWAMRVLTNDYLIDGFIDPKTQAARLSIYGYGSDSNAPIWLASARFQATHDFAAPVPAADKRAAVYFDSLIAIMPADEPGMTSVLKQNSAYQYPLSAKIYTGSYHINGNVMCADKQFRGYEETRILILRDVEINHRRPGSQLTGLKAPFIMLATRQIQALIPAA
jgi:hypothetical protein